jgi:hypothetical protein
MKPATLPLSGSCRCGELRFTVTADPLITAACHCTGCQKMSSSAYSLSAMFSTAAFAVTAGTPVVGGLHGPDLHHMFCPHCMTWVYTTFATLGDFVNVRPTMFDDLSWYVPFIETVAADKLPWVQTPARHSFAGFPPPEAFAGLLQEFALA